MVSCIRIYVSKMNFYHEAFKHYSRAVFTDWNVHVQHNKFKLFQKTSSYWQMKMKKRKRKVIIWEEEKEIMLSLRILLQSFFYASRVCVKHYREEKMKIHKVHPYLIHWSSFNLIASLLLHQCTSSYFNINSSWYMMSAKNYFMANSTR